MIKELEYPIVVYEERKYVCYVHVNKINGKKYVGITGQDPEVRWGRDGKRYGVNQKRAKSKFWNAICKYGWDNFDHIVLDYKFTYPEVLRVEMMLISYFDSKENGYNMTLGGDGSRGLHPSEETRRKLSEANKRENLSAETRRKLRESHLKENLSPELIEKYRVAIYRRFAEHGVYHFTEEQKKQLRRNSIHKMRAIICLNTMDVFLGVSYITDLFKCTDTAIRNNCNGKSRSSCKHPQTKEDLHWMFLDEYNNLDDDKKQQVKSQYFTGSPSLVNYMDDKEGLLNEQQ